MVLSFMSRVNGLIQDRICPSKNRRHIALLVFLHGVDV